MIRDLVGSVSGYPGLFALCAASGIVVPLPEDVSLLYAGAQIASGEWAWAPTLMVAIPGVLLRDVVAWSFGRLLGRWALESAWARRVIGGQKLRRASQLVDRHGSLAVLMGRFLVGFRAPVFVVAGAMGVGVRSFAAWDLLGLLVAVPGMIGLGVVFGDPIADLVLWAMARVRILGACALAAAALWIAWRIRRGTPEEG